MKKILSLILCLVLICGVLIGCVEQDIGSYLENYPEVNKDVRELTLNLYIIANEESTANAKETVQNIINQYTLSTFNTKLNIHYCSAEEYNDKVTNAINATDDTAAHIVLINNPEMIKSLVNYKEEQDKKLVDLTTYINSRDYGRLNSELPSALLAGAKIDGKLYAIPNNHIIGAYEYLVIDKAVARDELHYSPALLQSYKTMTDCTKLIEDMGKAGYDASKLIYSISGPYELKKELEDKGNFCNIVSYPAVDEAEAFKSAFAIVNRGTLYNDRAMQIIYALNHPNDHYFRNLLQYGVAGTNYTKDEDGNIIRVREGDNVYSMDLLYTGNLLHADYCEELGWTKEVYANAVAQNKESIVYVAPQATSNNNSKDDN